MLHSFKTQGTKTKTLLILATVGIISAFLVGSPQHASADQTYVSNPNQALTFSELEIGTTTNTIAQTGVSTETPTTVTTISHTSVDDIHTHENDYDLPLSILILIRCPTAYWQATWPRWRSICSRLTAMFIRQPELTEHWLNATGP